MLLSVLCLIGTPIVLLMLLDRPKRGDQRPYAVRLAEWKSHRQPS